MPRLTPRTSTQPSSLGSALPSYQQCQAVLPVQCVGSFRIVPVHSAPVPSPALAGPLALAWCVVCMPFSVHATPAGAPLTPFHGVVGAWFDVTFGRVAGLLPPACRCAQLLSLLTCCLRALGPAGDTSRLRVALWLDNVLHGRPAHNAVVSDSFLPFLPMLRMYRCKSPVQGYFKRLVITSTEY